jgi:hypothetical protein
MPPKKNGKKSPGKKGDESPKVAEATGSRNRSTSPPDSSHVQDVSQPQRPRPRSHSPRRSGPPRSRSNSRDSVERAVASPRPKSRGRRGSKSRSPSPNRVVLGPAAAAAAAAPPHPGKPIVARSNKQFPEGLLQVNARGELMNEAEDVPHFRGRGAVCGGGGAKVIKSQLNDLRHVDSRDENFKKQRAELIEGFALLLPMKQRKSEVFARAARSGLKPLVETFSVSIRPLTTQRLHDKPVEEFEQMMGRAFEQMTGITKQDKQTQFITCMDLLIQEAIINQISLSDAIVTSMSQV